MKNLFFSSPVGSCFKVKFGRDFVGGEGIKLHTPPHLPNRVSFEDFVM
jgi:hypothetical protein